MKKKLAFQGRMIHRGWREKNSDFKREETNHFLAFQPRFEPKKYTLGSI